MDNLMCREWPGNVRELENVVTRALVMNRGPALTLESVGAAPMEVGSDAVEVGDEQLESMNAATPSLSDVRSQVERRYVRRVLEGTGGNKSRAARVLQISRPTLNRMIEEYELAGR